MSHLRDRAPLGNFQGRVNLLLPHADVQGAQWMCVHRAQQSCFSACVVSLWFINTSGREEERRKEELLAGAAGREGRFTALWCRTTMKAFITPVELASLLAICFSFLTFTTSTDPPRTHTNICQHFLTEDTAACSHWHLWLSYITFRAVRKKKWDSECLFSVPQVIVSVDPSSGK